MLFQGCCACFVVAGYYSSTMWSQQELSYVEVVAAAAPVPVLHAPQQASKSFFVQVATTSGFTYFLDYKTNLAAPTWNIASKISGDGTIQALTDNMATDSWRFYRAQVR